MIMDDPLEILQIFHPAWSALGQNGLVHHKGLLEPDGGSTGLLSDLPSGVTAATFNYWITFSGTKNIKKLGIFGAPASYAVLEPRHRWPYRPSNEFPSKSLRKKREKIP